jgi:hypothetical protein
MGILFDREEGTDDDVKDNYVNDERCQSTFHPEIIPLSLHNDRQIKRYVCTCFIK